MAEGYAFLHVWQALMHEDDSARLPHKPHMPGYKEEAVAYLKAVIAQTEKTATELARLIDVNQTTLTRPLNNADHKYAIKFQTLQALAAKTEIPLPESLLKARVAGMPPAPKELRLAIRYEVAASGFEARDDLPQQPYGYRTVPSIPPYEHNSQWLERVISDSMDREIPVGSLIQVVDAIEIRLKPQHDQIVVVERTRADGALIERTVKQVALTPDGPEFWPRSHNPRWNKPISMVEGAEAEEDVSVQIVGLVLRAYQFFTPDDREE